MRLDSSHLVDRWIVGLFLALTAPLANAQNAINPVTCDSLRTMARIEFEAAHVRVINLAKRQANLNLELLQISSRAITTEESLSLAEYAKQLQELQVRKVGDFETVTSQGLMLLQSARAKIRSAVEARFSELHCRNSISYLSFSSFQCSFPQQQEPMVQDSFEVLVSVQNADVYRPRITVNFESKMLPVSTATSHYKIQAETQATVALTVERTMTGSLPQTPDRLLHFQLAPLSNAADDYETDAFGTRFIRSGDSNSLIDSFLLMRLPEECISQG